MDETVSERDTINIESNFHYIYKELTEGDNIQDAPFRTMKDVFMWALSLGTRTAVRKPLTTKKQSIFRWAQFDSQVDVPLLKAVAIAETSDIGILLRRNEILSIAEEYANAGIQELYTNLVNEQGRPLWNIVTLLNEQY